MVGINKCELKLNVDVRLFEHIKENTLQLFQAKQFQKDGTWVTLNKESNDIVYPDAEIANI